MLQAEFIKDMQCSYLLLQGNMSNIPDYKCKMLQNNHIRKLLDMEIRCFDSKNIYYYNITKMRSLEETYEHKTLQWSDIDKIIQGIIEGMNGSFEYLLKENDFILDPKYMYLEGEKKEVQLCYYSNYDKDINKQFQEFMEYLMNKVDYKDDKAVLLVYSLYRVSREENCTFEKLLEELDHIKKKDMIGNESLSYQSHPNVQSNLRNDSNSLDYNVKEEDIFHQFPPDSVHIIEEGTVEKEILKYKRSSYIYFLLSLAGIMIIGLIFYKLGVFYSTFGNMIEPIRIAIFLLLSILIGVISYQKLFSTTNQASVVIRKTAEEGKKDKKSASFSTINKKERESRIEYPFNKEKEEKKIPKLDKQEEEEKTEVTEFILQPEEKTELISYQKRIYYLRPLDENNYKYIMLEQFPYVVGKNGSGVDHVILDTTISRIHSRFEYEDNSVYIIDMNSSNGTYLNDNRLQQNEKYKLSKGDKIQFANLIYVYEEE